MLTPAEIKSYYKKLENWKIKELAQDAKTLRKDVIPILNQEIIDRNLGDELLIWVEKETNRFTGQERQNLIHKIKKEKCSLCLENNRLEGYIFKTVTSYIIKSDIKVEAMIICPECAKSIRINSIAKTFFLGWWSKSGLINTPFEIISSLIRMLQHKKEDARVINLFINENTGKIRESLEKNNLFSLLQNLNGKILEEAEDVAQYN